MNCKPGDLAVVVSAGATPEMIGAIVLVKRATVPGEPNEAGTAVFRANGPAWIVEAISGRIPTRYNDGSLEFSTWRSVLDRCLRPIRDNDGEDETLTWAGKPERINA